MKQKMQRISATDPHQFWKNRWSGCRKTFQLLGSAFNSNKDTWYAIQIDGKNGWIFGPLVSVVNPKEIDVSKIGTKVTFNPIETTAYSGPSILFTKKELNKKDTQYSIIGVALNHEGKLGFKSTG